MRRLTAFALMAGLAVTACSSSDDADNAGATVTEDSQQDAVDSSFADTGSTVSVPAQTPVSSTGSSDEGVVDQATSDASTPEVVTEADLARFIAATEEALQGTDQAGVVIDAPEIYIALAQAACARFSAGDSFDQIATDLLSQLADAGSTDDNERLVGAMMGAATRTLCPEHADKI
jgi:hypothetical protein